MVTTGSPVPPAACIVCQGRSFRLARSIRSHLDTIPDGLDRGADVDVTISCCQACGLLRAEQNDLNGLDRLYSEESISYGASISKLRERGDDSIYSRDEFEFVSLRPGRLLDV